MLMQSAPLLTITKRGARCSLCSLSLNVRRPLHRVVFLRKSAVVEEAVRERERGRRDGAWLGKKGEVKTTVPTHSTGEKKGKITQKDKNKRAKVKLAGGEQKDEESVSLWKRAEGH